MDEDGNKDCRKMSDNIEIVGSYTNGNFSGKPIINKTTDSGDDKLYVSDFMPNIKVLNKGNMVYCDNVGELYPSIVDFSGRDLTKKCTGQCMKFTVTCDVISDENGDAIIPIYPSIIYESGDIEVWNNSTNAMKKGYELKLIGEPNQVINICMNI